MHLIRVDLPAPLSPTSAITSPARTSKSTSLSASTEPNVLVMPRSSRSGCSVNGVSDRGGGAPGDASTVKRAVYLQYFLNSPTQTSLFLMNLSVKRRLTLAFVIQTTGSATVGKFLLP